MIISFKKDDRLLYQLKEGLPRYLYQFLINKLPEIDFPSEQVLNHPLITWGKYLQLNGVEDTDTLLETID